MNVYSFGKTCEAVLKAQQTIQQINRDYSNQMIDKVDALARDICNNTLIQGLFFNFLGASVIGIASITFSKQAETISKVGSLVVETLNKVVDSRNIIHRTKKEQLMSLNLPQKQTQQRETDEQVKTFIQNYGQILQARGQRFRTAALTA